MQHQLIKELCTISRVPCINIPGSAFQLGIDPNTLSKEVLSIFNLKGYCFSGFRFLPDYLGSFPLQNYRKTILFRDPRDSLTSRFFSEGYSHSYPKSGKLKISLKSWREKILVTSIDDFVTESAEFTLKRYRAYLALIDNHTLVRRYEDIVYGKEEWARDLAQWFDLEIKCEEVARIADRFNIFPEAEDPNKRIRAVHPGNYKKHLKLSTIESLNDTFKDVLVRLDYL